MPSSIAWTANDFLCTVVNQAIPMTGRQYIVSMSGSNSSGDADGDGVPDNQDAYPNDPTRAFDNYTPAAGFGTLAF